MDNIIRGTNTCIAFDLSQDETADLSKITAAELDIIQDGSAAIRKHLVDLDIDVETSSIAYTCTQQETLSLRPDAAAKVVLILMMDGLRRETRPVLTCWVEDTPLEEVM